MYEESIEELNKWIADEERMYSTGFDGEVYVVSELDVRDLCDFLQKQCPDLIGIPCTVGMDGIWFTKDDLRNARYL